MNKQEMEEWNNEMRSVIQCIYDKFPYGCKNITSKKCKQCLLDDKDDLINNHLCEIIAHIGYNRDYDFQRNSTTK